MPLIDPVTMSSPGGQASASASPAKASLPIELLPTSLAPIFAHVHPALLLSAYYLRFPALVADPTATLLNSLAPLAVVQMAYAVICLPVTGGTSARPPARKSKLGGSARKTGDAAASARPLTAFFALLLSLLSIPILTTIQILFGAPITTHIPHTLLSSSHLALLAIFPLVYTHGSSSSKWREILSLRSPMDEVFGGTVGCVVGAWLGAVPIPLDWDREWQSWPVTIVTGAYAGYVLGKMLGGWVLKGRRIELD